MPDRNPFCLTQSGRVKPGEDLCLGYVPYLRTGQAGLQRIAGIVYWPEQPPAYNYFKTQFSLPGYYAFRLQMRCS